MPEELLEQTKIGDSLEVGGEYHLEHEVVTILFSSPEQSTALNLEPEEGELDELVKKLTMIEKAYEER